MSETGMSNSASDVDERRCSTRPHTAHGDCPGSTRAIHGAKLAAQLAAIHDGAAALKS